MTDVSWQTFIKWVVVGAAALALTGVLIYGMVKLDESGGPDFAATEQAIARVCDPMKNTGIDYHGSGWSESSRYEVTCSDGSQRLVYPR